MTMAHLFGQYTQGVADYAWRIMYATLIFTALELAFSHSRYSLASRLRGALFWMLYISITVVGYTAFSALWPRLGLSPLFTIKLNHATTSALSAYNVVMWIAMPLLAAIIGDFFYYWFHRLQHSNRFLWAFHSAHHSLREMSALNSNHHFTEELFRIPFVVIPFTLLVGIQYSYAPVLIGLLLGVQGIYAHSNTRLHLGPLRYIVADNRYHRIHHSIEDRHRDTNFGTFPWTWDRLFGTAYFPARDEWPDTGIVEHDEPKTVREFLLQPFGKLRKSPQVSAAADGSDQSQPGPAA